MKRKLIYALAMVFVLESASQTALPSASEIEQLGSVVKTGKDPFRLNGFYAIGRKIDQWESENGFNWVSEREALTNLFLRVCSFNVPTNDMENYHALNWCRRSFLQKTFVKASENAEPFFDLVANQMVENHYFPLPSQPPELRQAIIAGVNGKVIYRDPQWEEFGSAYFNNCRRLYELNEVLGYFREGLIDLARPGVARRSAAMTDAEWTSFTNLVTTSAGLTKKEQTALFGSLRGDSSGQ